MTDNRKADVVVQDGEGYEQLLEARERKEAIEGIRRGLESMNAKRGMPADKFFDEFVRNKLSDAQ